MPRSSIDKQTRHLLTDCQRMMQDALKADSNEAEIRRRIERMFESVMGYDPFKHLSRERSVRGAGETEHVDFAIQMEAGADAKPTIMVEIKRIGIDLAPKHLKQVSSYAIDAGCEWILLTNGREWRVYHVTFGQPPITKKLCGWNLLTDDLEVVAKGFDLISYRNVKKGSLEELWQKTNVLQPNNMLRAILSPSSLSVLRREIRKNSKMLLPPEDIIAGIRRLLNETAVGEMDNLQLTEQKLQRRRRKSKVQKTKAAKTSAQEAATSAPTPTSPLPPPAQPVATSSDGSEEDV